MRRDRKLTDVHAHLEQYTSEELESVLGNAEEAGVKWILTSGFDLQTSLQGMEIAASREQVLASIGIHPWTAAENFPADFDESKATAGRLLDMGFFVSFGGAVTYPESAELRHIVRNIPLDGILIETDSPYMPLYLQRPEKNEPANVAQVAQTLAEIKKMDVEELIDRIYKNFTRLLQIED